MGVFGKICLSLAGAIVVGFLLIWAAAAGLANASKGQWSMSRMDNGYGYSVDAGDRFLSRLAFAPYRSTASWLVFLTLAIGAGVVWRLALRTSPSAPEVAMVETAGEPT